MTRRPALSYVAVLGSVTVLFHFLPISIWNLPLYFGPALAGSVATVWAARRQDPPDRSPWYLLAGGTLAWTLGEGYQVYAEINGSYGQSVNLADVCFLIGYALMGLGFLRVGRGRHGRGPANGAVDAAIVFVALAVLAWAFLVTPTTVSNAAGGLPATLRMMYPVADLALIVMLIWMGAAPQVRTGSYRVMTLSLVFWGGSNAGYHLDSFSSGTSTEFLQTTWLLSHVLWGTAVLMPSLTGFWARRDQSAGEDSAGRLTMLLIATMSAPLTLVLQLWRHDELDVVAVAIAGALMAALSTVRFRRLVRRMSDQANRLAHLSQTDFLTGLPNRRALTEHLESALTDRPAGVGVLVIDLDRFKGYNDTFGHRVGDELLVALARRWSARLGPGVFLARTGGDEFIAVIPAGDDDERAVATAWEVVDAVTEPVVVSYLALAVEVSVGVSVARSAATTADLLVHQADVAMYVAKERQLQVATYCATFEHDESDRVLLLNDLRGGLERGELTVHFQPQLDLATGRVRGVEALVRWFHPVRGQVPPDAFIPAAEKTGLIRLITTFVLDQSLRACRSWRESGLDLRVGVNVSARSLFDASLVDDVEVALARHGLPPWFLDLEVTESSAMLDIESAVETLGRLAALGVRLSIDDFGTGHSSLEYVQRLPMDVMKLDRSFVTATGPTVGNEMIVRSIIDLARSLGMETVAEGVEDITALDTLRSLGCDHAQGYGIARPLPEGEVVAAVAAIEATYGRAMRPVD